MNSNEDFDGLQQFTRIKMICARIFSDQKDIDSMKELEKIIKNSRSSVIQPLTPIIISVFFPILKNVSEASVSFKEKEKQQIVDSLGAVFQKIRIDKLALFFNFYGFLLFEIYDHVNHSVLNISEEYKLSIVECMTLLSQSLDSTVVEALYVKENAPKLCQMIYVVLEIAKTEHFKTLRISAVNCLMAVARVLDDNDFSDLVARNQIAEVFQFFLPGVASQLKTVALIDEKFGHKIPQIALKAWGRIVVLLMQDYNTVDQKIKLDDSHVVPALGNKQWQNENELKEYMEKVQRSPSWYKETDKKLQEIIVQFAKLTHHSHPSVRRELANLGWLLIENCVNTMPTSVSCSIDIIVSLSEDDEPSVSQKCKQIIDALSEKLSSGEFKVLLDNLEESFYNHITGMPRKFNGIDERVQIVALNSLIGFINLFGRHNLTRVLHSPIHLNRLVLTLIHISEFDKSQISVLEEYTSPDYELHHVGTSWKKFRYFKEASVVDKIETVCHLLAKHGATSLVSDFLLDIIEKETEQRKEAIFLLNEVATSQALNQTSTINVGAIKNVISMYVDPNNWYLPLSVGVDDEGYEQTLSDVQNNIIQVSLLVEGVGKMAISLNREFEQFMLRTLYLVLERAGSAHPVVRSAGISALTNISSACGYSNITQLINANIDYISFHIERKLKGSEDTGRLNVLAVVIQYGTAKVLNSTCDLIQKLLLRSHDEQTNLNSYFQVFKMFILGVRKWLKIEDVKDAFRTKQEKEEQVGDFKVSNTQPLIEDFSDDIMGKTAEEMYKEDLEKSRTQIDMEINPSEEEYKKPEPPVYIKLTSEIMNRSLHCLPSRDQTRKLLVLEILMNGLFVLKDWEDELLPIVHQIWSPLIGRFKDEPVVVNFSFRLLVVMAKLSKDFIRRRTAKEALPNILEILDKLAAESYLKDKGNAYRYSQNYKLQLTVLDNLAEVITDSDLPQSDLEKCMEIAFKYLSDKQPLPLQVSALTFFKTLIIYDPDTARNKLKALTNNLTAEFEKNVGQLDE